MVAIEHIATYGYQFGVRYVYRNNVKWKTFTVVLG